MWSWVFARAFCLRPYLCQSVGLYADAAEREDAFEALLPDLICFNVAISACESWKSFRETAFE